MKRLTDVLKISNLRALYRSFSDSSNCFAGHPATLKVITLLKPNIRQNKVISELGIWKTASLLDLQSELSFEDSDLDNHLTQMLKQAVESPKETILENFVNFAEVLLLLRSSELRSKNYLTFLRSFEQLNNLNKLDQRAEKGSENDLIFLGRLIALFSKLKVNPESSSYLIDLIKDLQLSEVLVEKLLNDELFIKLIVNIPRKTSKLLLDHLQTPILPFFEKPIEELTLSEAESMLILITSLIKKNIALENEKLIKTFQAILKFIGELKSDQLFRFLSCLGHCSMRKGSEEYQLLREVFNKIHDRLSDHESAKNIVFLAYYELMFEGAVRDSDRLFKLIENDLEGMTTFNLSKYIIFYLKKTKSREFKALNENLSGKLTEKLNEFSEETEELNKERSKTKLEETLGHLLNTSELNYDYSVNNGFFPYSYELTDIVEWVEKNTDLFKDSQRIIYYLERYNPRIFLDELNPKKLGVNQDHKYPNLFQSMILRWSNSRHSLVIPFKTGFIAYLDYSEDPATQLKSFIAQKIEFQINKELERQERRMAKKSEEQL